MSWSVTLAGRTFTQSNVEGNAYADEENGLPAILQATAEAAASLTGIYVTSSTSATAAIGTMVLTTHQSAEASILPLGTMVRAASASDLGVYVVGSVVSYSGTSLELDVTIASGGGPASDWVVGHPFMVVQGLLLDPAPRLGADLDAQGNAVSNTSNLESYAVTLGTVYALSI